jgi:hypothetical protein
MAPPPPRPAASRQGGPASSGASPSSSSRAKEEKQAPQTFFLGRYRVVDEIGVGGMASVHLARMDGPGGFQKWVAIKRIHPHLVEDDQFVDMFLDEARIVAGIRHPNVVQVQELAPHRAAPDTRCGKRPSWSWHAGGRDGTEVGVTMVLRARELVGPGIPRRPRWWPSGAFPEDSAARLPRAVRPSLRERAAPRSAPRESRPIEQRVAAAGAVLRT